MMLSDMGAEVIRIDRPAPGAPAPKDVLVRNRRSLAVDLKSEAGRETVLRLCEGADAIFEGFRPGVTERLGLGPEDCMARNPKLVYGRMTGWGQEGPMAQAAGHDINYIGLSGALHAIGRAGERPVPPLNLVGDFGGGGMLLAYGLVCGLLEAQRSARARSSTRPWWMGRLRSWACFSPLRLRGALPISGARTCSTARPTSTTPTKLPMESTCLGSIEPQFYALLIEKAGLDPETFKPQMDRRAWPELKAKLTEVMKQKTRDEWCAIMEGTDVCFAPVLSIFEAPEHPHNKARNSFITVDGISQQAPAPRFSRTVPTVRGCPAPGADSAAVLADFGFSEGEVAALMESGAVAANG